MLEAIHQAAEGSGLHALLVRMAKQHGWDEEGICVLIGEPLMDVLEQRVVKEDW